MNTEELELFLNNKLSNILERDVNIKVYQGVDERFMPSLKFIYKGDVVYEYKIGEFSPFKLQDIEYNLVTYMNDPMTLALIDKILEYDKNSWYVFLAP